VTWKWPGCFDVLAPANAGGTSGEKVLVSMQYYKSLRVAFMICATVVNTHTYTHTRTQSDRDKERERESQPAELKSRESGGERANLN